LLHELKERRSLHYATPDFLLVLVALANVMRPSLLKAAHAVVSDAARQEIRVRSGRDEQLTGTQRSVVVRWIVITDQGNEGRQFV
jgi:hypothetical protein